MNIQESIIHKIDKAAQNAATIQTRDNLLPLDDRLQKLGDDVSSLYGSMSNGYGTLSNEATAVFPQLLSSLTNNEIDFVDFSQQTTELLKNEIQNSNFATTSYPIFVRFEDQNKQWLLIALLKIKDGVGLDEETLDLNDSLFFDISNLREAARIDITRWESDEKPYLSFIKRGSGSEGDSSVFLRKALSCDEYTDSKANSIAFLAALDDFFAEKDTNAEGKIRINEAVLAHANDMKSQKQPVTLISLSAVINPEIPAEFLEFVNDQAYELHDTFDPHANTFKKLQRISRKFGSINLAFSVEDIAQDRIVVDGAAIIIRNPPADLVAKILELTCDDEDE